MEVEALVPAAPVVADARVPLDHQRRHAPLAQLCRQREAALAGADDEDRCAAFLRRLDSRRLDQLQRHREEAAQFAVAQPDVAAPLEVADAAELRPGEAKVALGHGGSVLVRALAAAPRRADQRKFTLCEQDETGLQLHRIINRCKGVGERD